MRAVLCCATTTPTTLWLWRRLCSKGKNKYQIKSKFTIFEIFRKNIAVIMIFLFAGVFPQKYHNNNKYVKPHCNLMLLLLASVCCSSLSLIFFFFVFLSLLWFRICRSHSLQRFVYEMFLCDAFMCVCCMVYALIICLVLVPLLTHWSIVLFVCTCWWVCVCVWIIFMAVHNNGTKQNT